MIVLQTCNSLKELKLNGLHSIICLYTRYKTLNKQWNKIIVDLTQKRVVVKHTVVTQDN